LNYPKTQIKSSLKDEIGRLFLLGVGVFLFILFFQPFPLEQLDFNNRLLYVTGFGAITFFVSFVILVAMPLLTPKWFRISEWESGPPILLTLLLLVFTVAAFAFFIRYVGKTPLSLYIMFKVILVCLLPLIILIILYKNKSLADVIETLQEQNEYYLSRIGEYEEIGGEEEIDIISANNSDRLTIKIKNIVSVKSADNYIEIFYLENDLVEKKLIRNTLKNIETQLANRTSFIRCHRTSIVNTKYIEKLESTYSGNNLRMSCYEEMIPVSRQYLRSVREALSVKK